MLEIVAAGLGPLREQVVFVGGTTTAFYITDPAAPEVRPTDDVDCIIEVAAIGDYYKLEKQLRDLGFRNDAQGGVILCRWKYRGITVDVMPTNGKVVGFTNRWYPEGLGNRMQVKLPSGLEINVLSLPYFIATKLEAYRGRGGNDLRTSHDIEDIVTVLDGCREIEEKLLAARGELKAYLNQTFSGFLGKADFDEALQAHLPHGPDRAARAEQIRSVLIKWVAS